ncbi:TadE/TadG family type IV pilus assembly protein [Caulobacter sp. KR2-114]|uniref:TadE/TadG family type IV pilus assembly protein n=1 Tax=Caulobacter sp. KR2-114 TaxID=3400912 RepID=UPI003C06F21F
MRNLPRLTAVLRRFARDHGGAAAVEMALVSPLLAGLLVGIANYAPELDQAHKMRDAVQSAATYVMTGGSDPTAIRTVATTAWTGYGSGDTVSVSQWCSCAGVAGSCTTLCADSSVPQGYTTISASMTYVGPLGSQPITATQTVRTR